MKNISHDICNIYRITCTILLINILIIFSTYHKLFANEHIKSKIENFDIENLVNEFDDNKKGISLCEEKKLTSIRQEIIDQNKQNDNNNNNNIIDDYIGKVFIASKIYLLKYNNDYYDDNNSTDSPQIIFMHDLDLQNSQNPLKLCYFDQESISYTNKSEIHKINIENINKTLKKFKINFFTIINFNNENESQKRDGIYLNSNEFTQSQIASYQYNPDNHNPDNHIFQFNKQEKTTFLSINNESNLFSLLKNSLNNTKKNDYPNSYKTVEKTHIMKYSFNFTISQPLKIEDYISSIFRSKIIILTEYTDNYKLLISYEEFI